jgi:hypothetical protein
MDNNNIHMDPHHLAPPCSDECVANFNASTAHIAALERYVAQLEQFLLPGAAAHSSQAQAFLRARRNHFLATRLSARNTLEIHLMAAQQRQQQQQQQQQQQPINGRLGRVVALDRSYNLGLNPYPIPAAGSPITNAHHDLGRMPSPTTSPASTRDEDDGIVPSIVPSCSLQLQLPDSNDDDDMSLTNTFYEEEEPDSDDDDNSSSPSLKEVSTRMDNNSPQQQQSRSENALGVPANCLLPQQQRHNAFVPRCCQLGCNRTSEAEGPAVVSCYRDFSRLPTQLDEDAQNLLREQPKTSFCTMISKSNARTRKSFPGVLMDILSREDITDFISWRSHGRAWIVHEPKAFEYLVLGQHFNHSKFHSFMRQVNGWGFQRIQHGKDKYAYYHEVSPCDQHQR